MNINEYKNSNKLNVVKEILLDDSNKLQLVAKINDPSDEMMLILIKNNDFDSRDQIKERIKSDFTNFSYSILIGDSVINNDESSETYFYEYIVFDFKEINDKSKKMNLIFSISELISIAYDENDLDSLYPCLKIAEGFIKGKKYQKNVLMGLIGELMLVREAGVVLGKNGAKYFFEHIHNKERDVYDFEFPSNIFLETKTTDKTSFTIKDEQRMKVTLTGGTLYYAFVQVMKDKKKVKTEFNLNLKSLIDSLANEFGINIQDKEFISSYFAAYKDNPDIQSTFFNAKAKFYIVKDDYQKIDTEFSSYFENIVYNIPISKLTNSKNPVTPLISIAEFVERVEK